MSLSSRLPLYALMGGFCLTWRMMDLMREMSRDDLDVFGLKSQSLVIRSHSVPGSIFPVSATSSFSADLEGESEFALHWDVSFEAFSLYLLIGLMVELKEQRYIQQWYAINIVSKYIIKLREKLLNIINTLKYMSHAGQ